MKNKTVEKKKGVGEIKLYTLTHCRYCNTLKEALSHLGVPYRDINVESAKHSLLGDWLEENLKTESYPIIHLEKYPGESIYIISKTNLEKLNGVRIFTTIDQALEILLNYYYEI